MTKQGSFQVRKSKTTQKTFASSDSQEKKKTFLIRNISGQDLTVCGVRINPFEKLQLDLVKIPPNLKRLEERGLIEITELDGG